MSLYNAFATDYDNAFERIGLRRIYDELAWRHASALLPSTSCTVVDVGCGTGRWVERLLHLGHSVIGIEPSEGMLQILRSKWPRQDITLIPLTAERTELAEESVDAVFAMGSFQYMDAPLAALQHMARWLKPGGLLCLHVDGLPALAAELCRVGRDNEALERTRDRLGVFTYKRQAQHLHLFDTESLSELLRSALFANIEMRGLLVGPTIFGRAQCESALTDDPVSFARREQALSDQPALACLGKHIMAWGRKPSKPAEHAETSDGRLRDNGEAHCLVPLV